MRYSNQRTRRPKNHSKGHEDHEREKQRGPVIHHHEELVDLKCLKLPKLTCTPGNQVANLDAWNIWKAKGKMTWKACAEDGDRLWLRHEVRAELSAEAFFELNVAERAEAVHENLDIEHSRKDDIIHNKLLNETVSKLPDCIFRDVERFSRRFGGYNLADVIFLILKRVGVSNANQRASIIAKLIPENCKNRDLHGELQEIQDRTEAYSEAGLIRNSHEYSEHFLALQKLLKGRAALKNRIDNWEETNRAPMIVEKTFFAKFLKFGIALVEEKYGISNDEKCDDPKQSQNERDEDDEE